MKKIVSLILSLVIIVGVVMTSSSIFATKNEAEVDSFYASADIEFDFGVGGMCLMEAKTGKVLYASREFEAASPASVTKVMTLLLVCEALEEGKFTLDDVVTISKNAASMGGSQVFLEEGERISVEELIKATVIASGNDSSVSLAELTAGSEGAFVKLMNQKALTLGLKNTSFENTTGLDDTTTNHYSCAADIATMSRELIKHEIILKYSSIWQDSIRNGEFTLTNTNRLVRYYDGCNGLKTGSTDKAGYCVSATAKRDNMQLIAVVMGADTKEHRNEVARTLLDYGFANYALYEREKEFVENANVKAGVNDTVALYSEGICTVVDKSKLQKVELIYDIPEVIYAPIKSGYVVGSIIYKLGNEQIGKSDIYASDDVERIDLVMIFVRIIKRIVCG